MATTVRTARADDIPACGAAMYEAFKDIATRHNFPPDFPNAEVAGGLAQGPPKGAYWPAVLC